MHHDSCDESDADHGKYDSSHETAMHWHAQQKDPREAGAQEQAAVQQGRFQGPKSNQVVYL